MSLHGEGTARPTGMEAIIGHLNMSSRVFRGQSPSQACRIELQTAAEIVDGGIAHRDQASPVHPRQPSLLETPVPPCPQIFPEVVQAVLHGPGFSHLQIRSLHKASRAGRCQGSWKPASASAKNSVLVCVFVEYMSAWNSLARQDINKERADEIIILHCALFDHWVVRDTGRSCR